MLNKTVMYHIYADVYNYMLTLSGHVTCVQNI